MLGVQQQIKKRLEQILNSLFFLSQLCLFHKFDKCSVHPMGKIPGQKKVRQEVEV